jgi:hypothetical protein
MSLRDSRTTAPLKQPLIVPVSGWGQEADRRASAAAGLDRHLVKPVAYADLITLLHSEPPDAAVL